MMSYTMYVLQIRVKTIKLLFGFSVSTLLLQRCNQHSIVILASIPTIDAIYKN